MNTQAAENDLKNEVNAIVLFDGVCNLCHHSVNFIIDKDPAKYFHFASLQSELGQALLKKHGLDPKYLDSVVLVENGKAYTDSCAVLHISKNLKGLWSWGQIFLIVPRFLRNGVYHYIARNRYKWFGKEEQCRLPTPDLKARFLD